MRRVLAIGAAITTVLGSTAFAAGHEPTTSHNTIEFVGISRAETRRLLKNMMFLTV